MKYLYLFTIGLLLLMGCQTTSSELPIEAPTQMPAISSTVVPVENTVAPTETPLPPTPTATIQPPSATPSPIPATATPAACVTLIYEEYAQFEIIGPSGQRVLVDVRDPQQLSASPGESDVLLTTHTHWDHWQADFQTAFPGLQLFAEIGMLEAPGAIIQGIASAHNPGDRLQPEGGTNYIYLIEIGGLRIAHFGDIGQQKLTEEQLTVLGQVDIAISQLHNPYSDMNAENGKGIHLMEQVGPRLLIPTHLNLDAVKLAVAQWPGYIANSNELQICESHLSREGTQILLMGEAADTMMKYMELTEWGN